MHIWMVRNDYLYGNDFWVVIGPMPPCGWETRSVEGLGSIEIAANKQNRHKRRKRGHSW